MRIHSHFAKCTLILLLLLPFFCAIAWAGTPAPGGDAGADLYAADPAPMTPQQCGQCHINHYGDLRKSGGRHRFDCRNCHQVIHAYNPVKGNYAALMPVCSQCHSAPHGEKHGKCLGCHVNPHAVATPPALAQVKDLCADCHGGPAADLKRAPSKHSKQACQSCHHDQHGYIPACSECHSPHYPEQPMAGCTACHPVHRPLEIAFGKDTQVATCKQCHEEVVKKWTGTPSKHGKVACADCHSRHGFKPQCQSCHGVPHSPKQLAVFPNCLDCHIDVHDLPVKK